MTEPTCPKCHKPCELDFSTYAHVIRICKICNEKTIIEFTNKPADVLVKVEQIEKLGEGLL